MRKSIVDVSLAVKAYNGGSSIGVIAKSMGVSDSPIKRVLKEAGVVLRNSSQASRKYSLSEHYFENIDNQDKAYFLGFLYADGYNNEKRNSIELSCAVKDKDTLVKLNKVIGSNKPVRFVQCKGIESYRIDWCSTFLCRDLSKLGCMQTKTLKLEFPVLRKDLISHFIRGYFDGDGCISYSYVNKDNFFGNIVNGVITMVSTESFCEYLKTYFKNKLDINSTILCRYPEHNNNVRTLQISGNKQVGKLMDWMYKGANLVMERKNLKYLELKQILKEREAVFSEKELVKLKDIVKNKTETWNARYLMSTGVISSSGKSYFTKEQAACLRSELDKVIGQDIIPSDIVEKEFKLIRKSGFPYYEVTKEQFIKGMSTFKKANIYKKDGAYMWGGKGTELATCFHPHIFECSRKNKKSALELFNDDTLLKSAIRKVRALYGSVSGSKIREICRNDSSSSRINNFPPRVAMAILKDLFDKPITVLDPCAGFSGRMVGCACSGLVTKYTAIDISKRTVQGLETTKEWLSDAEVDMDIEVLHGDCISSITAFSGYDCILTSPPFLDVERYVGVDFETDYEKWTSEFVKPFIANCFNSLSIGGKLVVYLEKINKIDFPSDFCDIAVQSGFKQCDPVLFKVSYGENNRSTAASRHVSILVFEKSRD